MTKVFSKLGHFQSSLLSSLIGERTRYVNAGQRVELLDGIKGAAACVIVGHHLSEFSPSAQLANQFAPSLMYGIYNYGLFIVHLFLVFGGFALAMAMPDETISWRKAFSFFGIRYVRLAAPYLVMLFLLVAVSWSALGRRMDPPLIDSFHWSQLFAHVFFLQDILGYGNLSAGTWYLCIDLQYVALFLIIQASLHAVEKVTQQDFNGPVAMSVVLIPLGLVSVWYWNRVLEYEIFVFYFLGPLVLGSLIAWTLKGKISWRVLVSYAIAMAASLAIEFRPRILVGLGSGLILYACVRFWRTLPIPSPILWLGKVSYSLFLIHYLVNGIVLHGLDPWIGNSPLRAFTALPIAFSASLMAAAGLHYCVEAPTDRFLKSLRKKRESNNEDGNSVV